MSQIAIQSIELEKQKYFIRDEYWFLKLKLISIELYFLVSSCEKSRFVNEKTIF